MQSSSSIMQVPSTSQAPAVKVKGGVFTYDHGNPVFIHDDGTWDFARGETMGAIFQAAVTFQKQADAGTEQALRGRVQSLEIDNAYLYQQNTTLAQQSQKQDLDKQFLDGLWATAQQAQRAKDAEIEKALTSRIRELETLIRQLQVENQSLHATLKNTEFDRRKYEGLWKVGLEEQKKFHEEKEKRSQEYIQQLEARCRVLSTQNKLLFQESVKLRRINELGLIPGYHQRPSQ